jgi:hypothetical protein
MSFAPAEAPMAARFAEDTEEVELVAAALFGIRAEDAEDDVRGSTGSLVARSSVLACFGPLLPKSRRTRPRAAHISGAAPGASPLLPPFNHDSSVEPGPATADVGAAFNGAAVMTGVAAPALAEPPLLITASSTA